MNCIFCSFATHEIEDPAIFYEDEQVYVKLDADWAVKGHALVIWKKHVQNMSDLDKKEFAHFSEIVRKTEGVLLKEINVDKSIVLKSGGIVPHFHFHIYPVHSSMPWDSILALFSKEARQIPEEGESENLVIHLKLAML